MTNNLFYTYLRLYPGKADVIMHAIKNGQFKAEIANADEKERLEIIECEILDALD